MEGIWFWSGLTAGAVPCFALVRAFWVWPLRLTTAVDVDLDRLAAAPADEPEAVTDTCTDTDTESRRAALARAMQRLPFPPGGSAAWSD
ncbi:MAG: hypothetical protein H7Z19_22955, partial [Chitinophagaceae bacterium]|nr:hypothetical protein [Rubrivivax sp.]